MVRATLRGLERQLVVERVEQRVCFRVQELVKGWRWAAALSGSGKLGHPLPDPLEFVGQLITEEGVYLPTFPRAIGYLIDCQSRGAAPEEKTLFKRLLPWSEFPVSGSAALSGSFHSESCPPMKSGRRSVYPLWRIAVADR